MLDDARSRRCRPSGERVAVIGCGTSWYMAMAYAALREAHGQGSRTPWTPDQLPRARSVRPRSWPSPARARRRRCSRRSPMVRGRTPSVVITAVPEAVAGVADRVVALEFADERSVVQTRFATTALALLRASLGDDDRAARGGRRGRARGAAGWTPGDDAGHVPGCRLDGRAGARGGAQAAGSRAGLDRGVSRAPVPPRPHQHRAARTRRSGCSARRRTGLPRRSRPPEPPSSRAGRSIRWPISSSLSVSRSRWPERRGVEPDRHAI